MLLPLLLATSVTIHPISDSTLQVPYSCHGTWVKQDKDAQSPGTLHVFAPHVTIIDKQGNKIGETGDNGGVFKCVTDTTNDGDDGGETL